MDCSRGAAVLADVPGRIEASNCSETSRLSIVSKASNFKGNSAKGLRRRDMMTEVQKSASPEVRHRHREVHSRVNKFAQNLHVLKMAVEAEKESLDPRFKQVRFFALHGARGKVRYIVQCLFVLQQYVHRCVGCGYAAIDCLDFEFSRAREGHLGSRPGKQARSTPRYHSLGACQEPVKRAPASLPLKGSRARNGRGACTAPSTHLGAHWPRRRFLLLLWRRGAGRGGPRSQPARRI